MVFNSVQTEKHIQYHLHCYIRCLHFFTVSSVTIFVLKKGTFKLLFKNISKQILFHPSVIRIKQYSTKLNSHI